jgi:CRISPR-associated protein (TIGR03986 family)
MNPRHNNPTKPERTARAPYNFVPLPEKVVPAEQPLPDMDRYHDNERYTGVIDCEITTESPVYVRGAVEPEFFEKYGDKPLHTLPDGEKLKYARFFSPDNSGNPVIPGSSLRGMVRSIVEIVAYGKMQWVTSNRLVFRAVGDRTSLGTYYRNFFMRDDGDGRTFTPLVQAGYLVKEKDRWFIRPAQSVQGVTFARIHKKVIPKDLPGWYDCKNARRIWVKPDKYDYQKVRGKLLKIKYLPILEARSSAAEGFIEAILVRSGDMPPKKKMETVIFLPDNSTPHSGLIEVDDDILQCYREQVSQKQEELLGGVQGALRPYQPVFYLMKDGKLVFFGHTMMFRLPYDRTPYEFVPPSLRAETSDVDIDLAEAIFGFTSLKRGSRAGRIFFGDARLEPGQSDIWLSSGHPVIPKILSGPKPTAFQHYLTQQQPDEVPSTNKSGKLELRLDHYASPPPHETVIRGHKLYWHKGRVGLSDIKDSGFNGLQVDKQHTLIKPVKAGVRFRSAIHFENLSRVELGAVLWALVLPGEQGREYRHKIGMGKPLGMGSVKLVPKLYLDDRKSRYSRLFEGQNWHQARIENGDLKVFTKAFEKHVLDRMHPEERGDAESLLKVERIKMLFKMLEWPGIKRSLTEYMSLDQFSKQKREVLPDPLHVEDTGADGAVNQRTKQAPSTQNVYHSGAMAKAFKRAKEKRNKRK